MLARQGVRVASSVVALRDALGELEAALSPAHVAPQFARAPVLVKGAWLLSGALQKVNITNTLILGLLCPGAAFAGCCLSVRQLLDFVRLLWWACIIA